MSPPILADPYPRKVNPLPHWQGCHTAGLAGCRTPVFAGGRDEQWRHRLTEEALPCSSGRSLSPRRCGLAPPAPRNVKNSQQGCAEATGLLPALLNRKIATGLRARSPGRSRCTQRRERALQCWIMLCSCAAPVLARAAEPHTQSAAAAATGDSVQEVVVTAQRREQSLLDVPVAVTALTSRSLETKRASPIPPSSPRWCRTCR